MIESADLRFLQTGRILLRTMCCSKRFCHSIRCFLTCHVFTILGDVSNFFLLPFPTLLAAAHFSPPSPMVRGYVGKIKPNRGEKWNIDFFFFSFFVFTQLLMVFSGFSFFTHHPPFSSPTPYLELSFIASHNSLPIRSIVV